jgi:hypothetical protein
MNNAKGKPLVMEDVQDGKKGKTTVRSFVRSFVRRRRSRSNVNGKRKK